MRRKIQLIRLHIFVIPNFVGLYENINALQSNVSKNTSKLSGITGLQMHYILSILRFHGKKMIV